LHAWLEKALHGERQLVFITGEFGIGKSALIEAFLERAAAQPSLWIARGQCVAHYGVGEAYLPILEVFTRLCHEAGREQLLATLNQYAPLWLAQMPSLLKPSDRRRLQREVKGASRARMLREMTEALEALTAEVPLILVLEDLHWSDNATLDLLAFLGARQEAARLLILCAYRPEEVGAGAHPLKGVRHELRAHGRCRHLSLSLLQVHDVENYLAARFPAHVFPSALALLIHQRTDGNALFVTNVVDDLVARNAIVATDGRWSLAVDLADIHFPEPTSIGEIIDNQLDRLSPQEEQVLKAASVAGEQFSTATVAAGVKANLEEIEELCEGLAQRQQFLRTRETEEWPDGTLATRYEFIHSLYQHGWYDRITAAKRAQLHQRIGERLEQGYGDRASEIAPELALHFDRGRDIRRALHYRLQAAHNAIRRFGHHEAIAHLTRGVELLTHLNETQERLQYEIRLQNALGAVYIATQGYASPAVERAYGRARDLCQHLNNTSQLAPTLWGLWSFYLTRSEFQAARVLAEQLLEVARQEHNGALLLEAERALGQTLYFLGQLPEAFQYLEHSVNRYDPEAHAAHAVSYGQDPKVVSLAQQARTLWLLGHPDEAARQAESALQFAQEVVHPYSFALARYHAAVVHLARRDLNRTQELTEQLQQISTEHNFPYWQTSCQTLHGWTLARQGQVEEGVQQMLQGLSDYEVTGAIANRPYALVLLAETYGGLGRPHEGLALLTEALAQVQQSGGHFYEAEMLRLRGELLLQTHSTYCPITLSACGTALSTTGSAPRRSPSA
jgi:predicted ATPase